MWQVYTRPTSASDKVLKRENLQKKNFFFASEINTFHISYVESKNWKHDFFLNGVVLAFFRTLMTITGYLHFFYWKMDNGNVLSTPKYIVPEYFMQIGGGEQSNL
jgi:hypothetical protein